MKYRNTQSILHNKDRLSCQKEKQPVKAKVPYLHWEKGILPTPVLPRLPVPPEGRKKKKTQLAVRLQENRQEQCSKGKKAVSLEERVKRSHNQDTEP